MTIIEHMSDNYAMYDKTIPFLCSRTAIDIACHLSSQCYKSCSTGKLIMSLFVSLERHYQCGESVFKTITEKIYTIFERNDDGIRNMFSDTTFVGPTSHQILAEEMRIIVLLSARKVNQVLYHAEIPYFIVCHVIFQVDGPTKGFPYQTGRFHK